MPYDHHLTFQDGRPLIYDSGDFPASLEKLKDARRLGRRCWPTPRQARADGRRVGVGLACYVEGTGVGPYEGAHVVVESSGKVKVATGLTTQGQGHFTSFAQIAADELGVPVRGRRGGDRRHPAVRLRGRHVRLAGGGDERQRDRAGVPQGARQGAAHRRRRAGGRPRRPGDRRRRGAGQGVAGVVHPAGHGRGAVQPAALRVRRGVQGGDPVRRPATPRGRRSPDGEEPGLEGTDYYSPTQVDLRQRHARGRSSRPTRRPPRSTSCATASCTTAAR